MRELQKRVAKLEHMATGEIPLVFVPMGATPEEARAEWLMAHPGEHPSKINCFISGVPEPDPLPADL
ncbi:hypothetical protein K9F62_20870 [Desulfovibrio sp. JY]|nr:hypothetical protein K9F62_20870 [Desulfovibrio sp. JY]